MKKLLFTMLTILALFAGCKKDKIITYDLYVKSEPGFELFMDAGDGRPTRYINLTEYREQLSYKSGTNVKIRIGYVNDIAQPLTGKISMNGKDVATQSGVRHIDLSFIAD